MNDGCIVMEDYIIQYVNKTIKNQDRIKLINHLKDCSQCREELAITLKLAEIVSKEIKEIPEKILDNMFFKIPESKVEENITIVSQIKSALEPLEIVTQILNTAKKSINLALQFI